MLPAIRLFLAANLTVGHPSTDAKLSRALLALRSPIALPARSDSNGEKREREREREKEKDMGLVCFLIKRFERV
jgi:hypothetical protein